MNLRLEQPSDAHGITWSIHVIDLDTGDELATHNPQQLLSTASLAKVFILIELAERLAADPALTTVTVNREAFPEAADSGIWQALSQERLPLSDVAALVGATSDNWGTNVLLGFLTLEAVQARAHALAPNGSALHDYVRDTRSPADPPQLSSGCAQDYTHVLRTLWQSRHEPAARQVLQWLGLNTDLSLVASAFDLDPLAHAQPDHGVQLWNKTGADAQVRADTGIVAGPRGSVAYAAIANWTSDDAAPRTQVMKHMQTIGHAVARAIA